MDKLTDEQIEMGLALEAKATPGPWSHDSYLGVQSKPRIAEHLPVHGEWCAEQCPDTIEWAKRLRAVEPAICAMDDGQEIEERLANADLIPFARNIVRPALEELRELRKDKWTCFHCGFETRDRSEAAAHFGDRDEEQPLCRTWRDLDADGRASEYQSAIEMLNAERGENATLRTANEGLEYRLLEYENLLGSRFKGCRSINDAFNLYDSMEGRALLAEEQLRELRAEVARLKEKPCECERLLAEAESEE